MKATEIANAKINLFLDVTGRRTDGYHNLNTIMQSISLSDRISVEVTPSVDVEIRIVSDNSALPLGKDNLAYVSAQKYISKFSITAKIDITIEKNIPIGAGLGGGSSDAAAVLRAMNNIFRFATAEQMLSMAAEIGSDVPFCLVGGRAVCKGRGDVVESLSTYSVQKLVVAIGKERISTPVAFAALDYRYDGFKDGAYTPVEDISVPYNIFESVTVSHEVDKIKEIMTKFGAEYTLMSGSGPAVFGVFADDEHRLAAVEILKKKGFAAFLAEGI